VRLVAAAFTVLVMAAAIVGAGMGESAAERQPAPAAGAVAASQQRIAAAGGAASRGRALFGDEGCDRCHSIAAIGADGKLGPRLDTIDEGADEIAEAIVEPREEIADDFPEKLMPGDYGERLSDRQVADLAAFVAAAAGGEGGGDDAGNGGGRGGGERSGRGRGATTTEPPPAPCLPAAQRLTPRAAGARLAGTRRGRSGA
jgi:mono/diheme cytochrome c family protein